MPSCFSRVAFRQPAPTFDASHLGRAKGLLGLWDSCRRLSNASSAMSFLHFEAHASQVAIESLWAPQLIYKTKYISLRTRRHEYIRRNVLSALQVCTSPSALFFPPIPWKMNGAGCPTDCFKHQPPDCDLWGVFIEYGTIFIFFRYASSWTCHANTKLFFPCVMH